VAEVCLGEGGAGPGEAVKQRGGAALEAVAGLRGGCPSRLLDGGRIRVTEIHQERNPYFGGVNPEPIRPNIDEALRRIVQDGAEVGLLLD